MRKDFGVYVLGIVVALTLLAMPVSALTNKYVSFNLDTYTVSLCPYSTTVVSAVVKNVYDKNIEVKLYSNSDWLTISQDSFVLAPGESKDVEIFVTPTEEAKPTAYTAKVYVDANGREDYEELNIGILDCRDINLDFEKMSYRGCIGDVLKIPFVISNDGKEEEMVEVRTSKGNLEFEKTDLRVGEQEEDYLYYKIYKDYDYIDVSAKSLYSFANANARLYVNGMNCYDFTTTVVPQTKDLCKGEEARYLIIVKNTGDGRDEYHIEASFGNLSDTKFSLKPGEEKEVMLRVKSNLVSEYAIKVVVKDKVKEEERTINLNYKVCKGVSAVIIPQNMSVCKGAAARFVVAVKNFGQKEEKLKVKSNVGDVSESTITLAPGKVKELDLYVDSRDFNYGAYLVQVNVSGSDLLDTASSVLHVRNCYNGKIDTDYKEVDACKATPSLGVPVIVKNTGEEEETYYLHAKYGYFDQDRLRLKPGEIARVKYVANVSADMQEGKVEEELKLEGKHMPFTKVKKIELNVLPQQECVNFSVEVIPPTITANKYKGYLYKVVVKNNGLADDTYTITLKDDYGIVDVQPAKLEVKSHDEGKFYLYVVPNVKMPNKQYSIAGVVRDKLGIEKPFNANFVLRAERWEEWQQGEGGTLIVHPNFDKDKVYTIEENKTESVNITYYMDGEKRVVEVLFVAGSFIIQVGDELVEDKNPSIGEKTYTIKLGKDTYHIRIEFLKADNKDKIYKFRIEDMVIERNNQQVYPQPSKTGSVVWYKRFNPWIIPILVVILGILLIIGEYAKTRKRGKQAANEEQKKAKAKTSSKDKGRSKEELEDIKKAIK